MVKHLNARLAELGYEPVARSSFHRWNSKHKKDPTTAIPTIPRMESLAPSVEKQAAPLGPHRITPAHTAAIDLTGIPRDLIDALGLRLMIVAKGDGLDRVEDAIVRVATAISNKAEAIADQLLATERESETVTKDGEKVTSKTVEAANAAKNAVHALSVLADSMHRIVASRTLFSVAHRNFADSDRLSGEGEKFRAEAETTRNAARADNARVINPQAGPHGFDDAEREDEALEALRDVEGQK